MTTITLPEVNDNHYGDDQLFWRGIEIFSNIRLLECSWEWKDQGWGNRKGCVFVHLVRGEESIASHRIGDIAEHENQKVDLKIGWNESEVLQQSQCGDKLVFKYSVGGGGGHRLYINNCSITFYSAPTKSARSVVR
mmetsp:Transcript_36884/g.63374  ORF Transcript_36884/g.63374 Transcript_36884/m.63374 type:complete len:136 (+) Transcript_36884:28-435(+)